MVLEWHSQSIDIHRVCIDNELENVESLDVTSDLAADKQTCITSIELVVSNREGLYIWGNKNVVFFLTFDIVYTLSKSIGTKVISSTVRFERHVLAELHGVPWDHWMVQTEYFVHQMCAMLGFFDLFYMPR